MADQLEALSPKLKGKVALVTGSGRGLGRAYALRLARLGADVVINDINLNSAKVVGEELSAETVMDEVRSFGVRSIGIEGDASDGPTVERMMEQILKEFGHIDILVNNAGGGVPDPSGQRHLASSTDNDAWDRTIDINLRSTFLCCKAVAGPMKEQRSGKIVNISSLVASAPRGATLAPYAAAKGGIITYTKVLSFELAPYGITVNCIAPGFIGTTNWNLALGQFEPQLIPQVPVGRKGTPEDCAKVIEFLVTDLSDYVTGQTIRVDGGMV